MSKDNQQESLYFNEISMTDQEKSWYIVGFADGEGSFNCSWRKRDDFLIGWKLAPVFNISQKDNTILAQIKDHLGCGTIRPGKDGVWAYEVDNQQALVNTIIPFFKKNCFLSDKKKRDFLRFQRIFQIVYRGNKSKTYQDLTAVLQLVADVEAKHARKYTDQEILHRALGFCTRNQEKILAKNQKHFRPWQPQMCTSSRVQSIALGVDCY